MLDADSAWSMTVQLGIIHDLSHSSGLEDPVNTGDRCWSISQQSSSSWRRAVRHRPGSSILPSHKADGTSRVQRKNRVFEMRQVESREPSKQAHWAAMFPSFRPGVFTCARKLRMPKWEQHQCEQSAHVDIQAHRLDQTRGKFVADLGDNT